MQNLRPVDLKRIFRVEGDFVFCLQFNAPFLWFFHEGSIKKFDYKQQKLNLSVKVVEKFVKLLCVPNGSCIFAITGRSKFLAVITETGTIIDNNIGMIDSNSHLFSTCQQSLLVRKSNDCLLLFYQVFNNRPDGCRTSSDPDLQQGQLNTTSGQGPQTRVIQEPHWLNYIYWMYTKFPCNDILLQEQAISHFWIPLPNLAPELCKKLQGEILALWTKLKDTKKPLKHLEIHTKQISLSEDNLSDSAFSQVSMGDFVRKLITFIPNQISRCQSNAFIILHKGQPVSLDSVHIASDLADKIHLGLYESIFKAWNGDIKVISSMGKQSTGKNYTLNHLTGSSFNIAGTRCTDGC